MLVYHSAHGRTCPWNFQSVYLCSELRKVQNGAHTHQRETKYMTTLIYARIAAQSSGPIVNLLT